MINFLWCCIFFTLALLINVYIDSHLLHLVYISSMKQQPSHFTPGITEGHHMMRSSEVQTQRKVKKEAQSCLSVLPFNTAATGSKGLNRMT